MKKVTLCRFVRFNTRRGKGEGFVRTYLFFISIVKKGEGEREKEAQNHEQEIFPLFFREEKRG